MIFLLLSVSEKLKFIKRRRYLGINDSFDLLFEMKIFHDAKSSANCKSDMTEDLSWDVRRQREGGYIHWPERGALIHWSSASRERMDRPVFKFLLYLSSFGLLEAAIFRGRGEIFRLLVLAFFIFYLCNEKYREYQAKVYLFFIFPKKYFLIFIESRISSKSLFIFHFS